MERITLAVEGMTCGGCVARVERALQAIGVAATVTRDPGRVTVESDGAVEPERIRQAIIDAGYPASVLASK